MRATRFLLPGLLLAVACGPSRMELASTYPVVPQPVELGAGDGAFIVDTDTRIVLGDPGDPELRRLAEAFAQPLRAAGRVALPVADQRAVGPLQNVLALRLMPDETGMAASGTRGPEAEQYELTVDRERVELVARSHAGVFRGLQTLRQLMPVDVETHLRAQAPWGGGAPASSVTVLRIPAVEIDDAPRFSYRGMHLDVGRHFFPVEFVKKYIDLLALYRMNTFHWHLTEDQGWRIQIRAYPRLTEVGSCRAETMVERNFDPYVGDGTEYCGFYTQAEIRDVVAYARERHIMVIPEIELPGHSVAALAAYPELACTDGPFDVLTKWGVSEDIYCPKEETFEFLQGVLAEVMELFPSPYIHIGGDEAPKARWEASPVAQEVIRREGLADEHELQSWFIQRIERFLNANGRSLIGWDEILEGGLAPNATVMSWRGTDGGIAAARQGHDAIMTPNSHLYFDHYQGDRESEPLAIGGFSPIEKIYGYEPVPEELSELEARHILGAQGNMWTEYMQTSDHVEYMLLPRLLALSEVVWSPKDARDWESFQVRLEAQLPRLDALGANYRRPDWMR